MRITIIGAGIVGLATAHALLDRGHEVILVEPGGKPGRPTDGNAGWIAHTDIMPLASPKAWRNLPRWLMDPLGPLTIRPGYLPQLAPWLARFILASSPHRIEASITAIRDINAEALPAWKSRLASLNLTHHLRESGLLSVWRHRSSFNQAKGILARQRNFGIEVETLSAEALAELEPALRNVEAAVLYPDVCHVSDTALLAADLMQAAWERGVTHVPAHATRVEPREGGLCIHTDGAPTGVMSDYVVICAGAWSRSLAGPLGDRIPLDTERGYNATYPKGTFGLSRPIMYEGEGFVTTPLDTGDRVGGAVEFAGLEAPPNHGRTNAMVQRLTGFLPHLQAGTPAKQWMGFRPSIPDSLPVIGPARKDRRVIYAFGHGHYGLTQAAVTSQMVAGLIDGSPGPVDVKPFSAQRF